MLLETILLAAFSCSYLPKIHIGTIPAATGPKLDEASGLVKSVQHPSVFWSHQDNYNDQRIFALRTDGSYLGTWRMNSVPVRDPEDIALFKNVIFLGDTGHNDGIWGCRQADCPGCLPNRDCRERNLTIFMMKEPFVDPHQKDTLTVPSYPVTSFQIKLPDSMLNQRQDIEAMFVDPLSTNSLYLFTKRTNKVVVLKVDPPFQNQSIKLAVEVARLTFNGATAADISPNGKMIVVRTYSTAFVWERDGTITQSLQKAPCIVSNITENQGEAITIQDDGSFFTTSEGSSAVPIWFYQNTSQ